MASLAELMIGQNVPLPRPDPRTRSVVADTLMNYAAALGTTPDKLSADQMSRFQRGFGVTGGRPAPYWNGSNYIWP